MEPQARAYAKEHREFLEQNRPDVLEGLRKDPEGLTSYLSSVGTQAHDREQTLLAQMNNRPEVQSLPYHQKTAALQSHHHSAREIVRKEIVHQPVRAPTE